VGLLRIVIGRLNKKNSVTMLLAHNSRYLIDHYRVGGEKKRIDGRINTS
jgi:hypothetical protein